MKKSTQKQREQLMEILKADKLRARSIDSIKPSDAKEWAVRMKENGYAYQTINIRLIPKVRKPARGFKRWWQIERTYSR